MIEIRQARSEDTAALHAIMQSCGMEGEFSADECLLAEEAGSAIGLLRIEQAAGVYFIRPIAVAPEARGSGVGTLLLDAAKARYPKLMVTARGSALGFYQRSGFQPDLWENVHPPFRHECEQCPDHDTCSPQPMTYQP